MAFEVCAPLTVAGAVTELAPNGYTAPCSLFIPACELRSGNHLRRLWHQALRHVKREFLPCQSDAAQAVYFESDWEGLGNCAPRGVTKSCCKMFEWEVFVYEINGIVWVG